MSKRIKVVFKLDNRIREHDQTTKRKSLYPPYGIRKRVEEVANKMDEKQIQWMLWNVIRQPTNIGRRENLEGHDVE